MKTLASVVFLLAPLFCGAFSREGASNLDMKCYICNSQNTPECAQNPTPDMQTKTCRDPEDQCITAIVEGVTHRGCKTEVNVSVSTLSDTCKEPLCNNKLFPNDRLKCYQCKGTDCIKDFHDTLKPCVNYKKDDNCVTNVIDENNVIRGCQSDPDYSAGLFEELCPKSGCNNHQTTSTYECIACSEADSKDCARMSTAVPPGQKCTVPKDKTCEATVLLNRPFECFTYKASNKVVRGCPKNAGGIKDDTDNFITCKGQRCNDECLPIKCFSCDSNADPRCADRMNELDLTTCSSETSCFVGHKSDGAIIRGCGAQSTGANNIKLCYVDGCNDEAFPVPTKKLECYKCDSKNLPECATNPSASLPSDQCEDPDDRCITAIVEGVTHRGCEKKVKAPNSARSDSCKDALCNDKLFPKDRLKCYQCKGKHCIKDFQDTLKLCVNYKKDDNCVTNVIDENNVIRGCQSDPDYSAGTFEELCPKSGCNNHQTTSTYECIACSEADSKDCARMSTAVPPGQICTVPKDKTCEATVLLNRPFECFTYKASNKVVRGCPKNAGGIKDDTDNFITCKGQRCNDECLPIKCFSCDSNADPRCADRMNELDLTTCSSETSCFVGHKSDGAIIRGCGAQSKGANNIKLCYVDGCNDEAFPVPTKKLECYKCNSKNLPECATNPSASLPSDQCEDPDDRCITAIVEGDTYRGCEKEVAPSYSLAHKCDSNLCNIKIFPDDRLKCYQCEGADCVDNFEKSLKPCVNYKKDSFCATIVKNKFNVIRKCLSDPSYKLPKYANKCESSGCNNHPATYIAECISCTALTRKSANCVRTTLPVASGENCTLPLTQVGTCRDTLLLNQPISCYTYTKWDSVTRGCTKDARVVDTIMETFVKCKGQKCNNACLPIKCFSCDSRKDQKCIDQTWKLDMQTCPSDTACFYGQTTDGATIRGCGRKSAEISSIKTCYIDGCNSEVLPPLKPPCKGNNCNEGKQPPKDKVPPKQCYQCKDDNNCRDSPDQSMLKACASPSDGCMQYVNLHHQMVRGCKSDKEFAECFKNDKECLQCSDDGCNNVKAVKTVQLSCFECDSSDKNCPYTINKDVTKKCNPTAPFYVKKFGCFSCLSKDNKIATRGCYSGETYTPNDDSNCNKCTEDNCNDKSLIVQSCIQCDGDAKSCNENVPGTECKGSLSSTNIGCYSKKIGNSIKRGCISDFTDPQVCKGGAKFCQTCLGQNCNTSGVTKLFASLRVILFPLLVSLYFTL